MIKPNYLLAMLRYLTGQHYNIDHINMSPDMYYRTTSLLKRINVHEVKIFKDYAVVTLNAKPIVIKCYGWKTITGTRNHYIFIDEKTNLMYIQIYIVYNHNPYEHSSL
jgi:hypothetical protein